MASSPTPGSIYEEDTVEENENKPQLSDEAPVLKEDFAKIHGVLCLGHISKELTKKKNGLQYINHSVGPNERVTCCFPIDSKYGSSMTNTDTDISSTSTDEGDDKSSETEKDNILWLYDGPSNAMEISLKTQTIYEDVLGQLLCNLTSSNGFQTLLRAKRLEKTLEELNAAEQGPRTISQVRKENIRKEDSGDTDADISNDSSCVDDTNASDRALYPKTIIDIARTQRKRGTILVLITWQCMWRGKLRYGLQILPVMSVVPNLNFSSITNNASVSTNWHKLLTNTVLNTTMLKQLLSDYVNIAIKHPTRHKLIEEQEDNCITISLEAFTTVTDMDIYLTAECLDKRSVLVHSNNVSAKRNPSTRYGNDSLGPIYASSAAAYASCVSSNANTNQFKQIGLRWQGKLKVVGMKLKPNVPNTLQFVCSFFKTGLFDVNRYCI